MKKHVLCVVLVCCFGTVLPKQNIQEAIGYKSGIAENFNVWKHLLSLMNVVSGVSGDNEEDVPLIVQGLLQVLQSSGALIEEYEVQDLLWKLQNLGKDQLKSFLKELFGVVKDHLFGTVGELVDVLTDYFNNSLTSKESRELLEEVYKGRGKKRKIASAIFGALADACGRSQSEDEKQQGVLNLFGTAFALASQIAAISADETCKNPDEEVVDLAVLLVEDVCDLMQEERDQEYSDEAIAMLLELSSIKDEAARKEKILQTLQSQVLAEKILTVSLTMLREFLHEKVEDVVDFLETKLQVFFMGYKLLFMRKE
jgi:hypothetical protein